MTTCLVINLVYLGIHLAVRKIWPDYARYQLLSPETWFRDDPPLDPPSLCIEYSLVIYDEEKEWWTGYLLAHSTTGMTINYAVSWFTKEAAERDIAKLTRELMALSSGQRL